MPAVRSESGRGQPHSKTLRKEQRADERGSVLDCGCPLPLSRIPRTLTMRCRLPRSDSRPLSLRQMTQVFRFHKHKTSPFAHICGYAARRILLKMGRDLSVFQSDLSRNLRGQAPAESRGSEMGKPATFMAPASAGASGNAGPGGQGCGDKQRGWLVLSRRSGSSQRKSSFTGQPLAFLTMNVQQVGLVSNFNAMFT